jgi:hypothetical protein
VLTPEDDEDLQRQQRQADWRARSVLGLTAHRALRFKTLNAKDLSIRRAVEAYARLDAGSVPHIGLRTGFIRLDPPRPVLEEPEEASADRQKALQADLASRPPLTKLIHRKTNALQVYLTAIYLAHLDGQPGKSFRNERRNAVKAGGQDSWALLAGLAGLGSPRARRLRVTRTLAELASNELVAIGPDGLRDRFEFFELCREDGSHRRYSPPGAASGAVLLPAAFFAHGWHLVLEPKEIATLLAIVEMTRSIVAAGIDNSIALPEVVRWERFGLSGEAYESIHELEEFGLISIRDPMPNRRRGKVRPPSPDERSAAETDEQSFEPVPYRFTHRALELVFNRDARSVVSTCLRSSTFPPRLLL